METSGFEVVHSEVVGFVASSELGRVGPEQAYELGLRTDRPDADAIIMPGGNWPSMSIVERLERELGKPVLANNAVSLWAGLRLLRPLSALCRLAARRYLRWTREAGGWLDMSGPKALCSTLWMEL